MKKMLLFLIFVLTGCSINYDVKIDTLEKIYENAAIIENEESNFDFTFSNMNLYDYNNYYVNDYIPIHFDDLYSPEGPTKFEGVSYYEKKDLTEFNQIGISFSGKFKSINSFSRSNLIWKSCKYKSIKKNDESFNISVRGFKIFDEYKILDRLTINIKSKYDSINNNADSVKNGIYTWVINRDNYNQKSVDITFKTTNIVDDFVKESKTNVMFKFTYAIAFVVIVGVVIYLLVKRKYKKNNIL